MSSGGSARSSTRSSGAVVEVAAAVPILVLRLGVAFLRMKARRRKGIRVFKSQLRQNGFTKWQVKDLAARYERMGSLRNYLRGNVPGLPFFLG